MSSHSFPYRDRTLIDQEDAPALDQLLAIMDQLRDPDGGCPWDVEQDFATIAPYTIEEAYEVADAIERGSMQDLKEELGDLLLQVAFHSQIAEENNFFTFEDVAKSISEKMIRRHPHVFAGADLRDAETQVQAWEATKDAERASKGAPDDSVLANVPIGLPALTRAEKLSKRAARVGFDWPEISSVYSKIEEEFDEVKEAVQSGDQTHIQEEIGDLLFAVANLARKLKVDPETALRNANAKFNHRFRTIETSLNAQGSNVQDADLETMEALWVAAKTAQPVKS